MFEFMLKELFILFRDKLKEQWFSTLLSLLFAGLLGFGVWVLWNELKDKERAVKTEIDQFRKDLSGCNEARAALEVKVSFLEETVKSLQIKGRKK